MAATGKMTLKADTPVVAGIIVLGALGTLIALRKGFSGVSIKIGK